MHLRGHTISLDFIIGYSNCILLLLESGDEMIDEQGRKILGYIQVVFIRGVQLMGTPLGCRLKII
jgi:hypothetical protein